MRYPNPLRSRSAGWRLQIPIAFVLTMAVMVRPCLAEMASVDGLDIHYEVHGDPAAGETPVLLLHGGMNSIAVSFADLLPGLASNHPVIAIEQQGHGHTGDRDRPITLSSMRADTLAVLDRLGVERAHVVGYSMGAMLGLDLAVHSPERVATPSALSASQNVDGMSPEIVAINRDPSAKPSPEVAALLPDENDFEAMQAAFADNPGGTEQFDRTMKKLNALITGPWGWSDAELAAIRAPVLLAIGDRDFVLPGEAVRMANTIPDAQLSILPGTTHMTIMKRADWLVPMIEQRIAADGAAGPGAGHLATPSSDGASK